MTEYGKRSKRIGTPPFSLNTRYLLMTILFWCSQYIYTAYFTPWLEGIQISAQLIGTITGSYGFSQLLIRIPLGIYADRNGKHRPVILAGLIIVILPGLLLRYVQIPGVILFVRFLAGVASSTWVSITVFYQNATRGETNRNMGTINAANSAGLLLAFLISSVLVDSIGINGLFLLSSLLGIVATVIFLISNDMAAHDVIEESHIEIPSFRNVFFQRELLWSSALMAVSYFTVFATVQGFSANVAVAAGLPTAYLGILSAIFTAAGLVAQSYIAKRSSSVRGDRILLVFGFLTQALHAIVLPYASGPILFMILYAISGLGRGVSTPLLMANAVRRITPARRGTAMGTFQSIYSLGMFAGPQLMGILIAAADGSYKLGFMVSGIITVLGAGFSLLIPISTEMEENTIKLSASTEEN